MADPIRATEKEWEAVHSWAKVGDHFAPPLLELRDRVAALEAAAARVVPAGVTVEELADCLPVNAWAGPEGYSRQAFARHLLDHPRLGALLRGEGAPAPKRVVLPEDPPAWRLPQGLVGTVLARQVWAAAHAEVERQQQGGQADG